MPIALHTGRNWMSREVIMRAMNWFLGATTAALLSFSAQAQTLRAVMHADIKIMALLNFEWAMRPAG